MRSLSFKYKQADACGVYYGLYKVVWDCILVWSMNRNPELPPSYVGAGMKICSTREWHKERCQLFIGRYHK